MKKYMLGLLLASIIIVAGIAVVVKNSNNESSKSSAPGSITSSNSTNSPSISSNSNSGSSFTKAEVATHNKPTDCWIIVSNNIYDVSTFVNKHPGGSGQITPLCGKDATSAFEGQHGDPNSSSRQAMELGNLKIGSVK